MTRPLTLVILGSYNASKNIYTNNVKKCIINQDIDNTSITDTGIIINNIQLNMIEIGKDYNDYICILNNADGIIYIVNHDSTQSFKEYIKMKEYISYLRKQDYCPSIIYYTSLEMNDVLSPLFDIYWLMCDNIITTELITDI